MRSYLIDDVPPSNMERIRIFLKENAIQSSIEKVFWLQVPDDLLSNAQSEHRHCRPHVFAMELGSDWVRLEFYVRSLKSMRCSCPGYCTKQQMDFVVNFAHRMIETLDVKT